MVGGLGGLVAGVCTAFVVAGAMLGMMWIFVFGDNPWPDWSNILVAMVFMGVVLACVATGGWLGYRHGIARENSRTPRRQPHALY